MPFRFARRPAPLDEAFAALGAGQGIAAAIVLLARRLDHPLPVGRCLALAGRPDAEPQPSNDPAVRFIRALRALDRQRCRSRGDPRLWLPGERRRLFLRETLVGRCAHDRVLAALADRVVAEAVARLLAVGDNPARLALEAMGAAPAAQPPCAPATTDSGRTSFTSASSCV